MAKELEPLGLSAPAQLLPRNARGSSGSSHCRPSTRLAAPAEIKRVAEQRVGRRCMGRSYPAAARVLGTAGRSSRVAAPNEILEGQLPVLGRTARKAKPPRIWPAASHVPHVRNAPGLVLPPPAPLWGSRLRGQALGASALPHGAGRALGAAAPFRPDVPCGKGGAAQPHFLALCSIWAGQRGAARGHGVTLVHEK